MKSYRTPELYRQRFPKGSHTLPCGNAAAIQLGQQAQKQEQCHCHCAVLREGITFVHHLVMVEANFSSFRTIYKVPSLPTAGLECFIATFKIHQN